MERLNAVKGEFYTMAYYEEAPDNAEFPYCVIPTLSISPLSYGYQCLIDVEIHADDANRQNIDSLCEHYFYM